MARPRVVRTSDGAEVVMRNLAPEMADKVKALLSGEDSADEAVVEAATEAPTAVDLDTLKNTAIGTFYDGSDGKWKLAVVKFNGATKQASVEQVITAGIEKTEASERFKIFASTNGLVV